jgi:hypothetical protein
MGGDNVELLWCGLCLIKALITLFVLLVVELLCKRFFRCIPRNFAMRRSAKHPVVHSLNTVQPTRETADLDPGDTKRRTG